MTNDGRVKQQGRVSKQLAETQATHARWHLALDALLARLEKKQDRSAGVSPAVAEASRPRDFIPRTPNFPQAQCDI